MAGIWEGSLLLLKQCWTEKKGGRSGQETGLQMSGNWEVGRREGNEQ